MKKRAPRHFTVADLDKRGLKAKGGRETIQMDLNASDDREIAARGWTGAALPWAALVPELMRDPESVEARQRMAAVLVEIHDFARWQRRRVTEAESADAEQLDKWLAVSEQVRRKRLVDEKTERDKNNIPPPEKALSAADLAEWLDEHPRNGASLMHLFFDAAEYFGVHERTVWRGWDELTAAGHPVVSRVAVHR